MTDSDDTADPVAAHLDPSQGMDLSALRLTYADVGASVTGTVPDGFSRIHREAVIGTGQASFDAARTALLAWQVQLRSRLDVRATSPTIAVNTLAELGIGPRFAKVTAPVRVIAVVDEPREAAFAYGSLSGHPESGEECFRVTLADDGSVVFTVDGFSRPATLLAKLGGPITRRIQARITDRYMAALA